MNGISACTDLTTSPWILEAGVEVLDQPFYADGNIATAGGCLAGWTIAKTEGMKAAEDALYHVVPVGEKESFFANATGHIRQYLAVW